MPQAADLGSKRLISLRLDQWARWVTDRADVIAEEVVSAEYQWVGRADDTVIRAYCPGQGHFAVPIEVQLRPKGVMPWRMFGYSDLFAEKTHLPVFPVVIHLLPPEHETPIPTAYNCECMGLRGHQDYRAINIWEVDSDLPFQEALRGLLPFVPLMRGGSTREQVLRARRELRADEDLSQMEPLLAFFASYFLGTEFVSEMRGWKMDLIVDSPLFKEMMRQERERAAVGAALAKAREYIIENLDARFGAVPPAIAERIEAISDLGQLSTLHRRAGTAASLDEFVRSLEAPA